MTKNEEVFRDFVELLKKTHSLINLTMRISANVIYSWNYGKEVSEELLEVHFNLHSESYGDISLFNGKRIIEKDVHTKVESRFSNPVLSISENNSLVIIGKSGKIGDYKIIIIPN